MCLHRSIARSIPAFVTQSCAAGWLRGNRYHRAARLQRPLEFLVSPFSMPIRSSMPRATSRAVSAPEPSSPSPCGIVAPKPPNQSSRLPEHAPSPARSLCSLATKSLRGASAGVHSPFTSLPSISSHLRFGQNWLHATAAGRDFTHFITSILWVSGLSAKPSPPIFPAPARSAAIPSKS